MNRSLVASDVSTLVLAAALAWALSAQAQAQNASDQGAADQSTAQTQNGAAGAETLQEVVVTAERRATDIQATPIAVTALQGAQLQSLHIVTPSDLQNTVPGFQLTNESGFYGLMNIRGIGASTNVSLSQSAGVTLFRDGLYVDDYLGQNEPMYDIADTEVLEGPQGTFVGASASGGAVEINSADPNFNGFHGYVLSGYGNYEDIKTQGAVNLPMSDTFAMRLAFDYEHAHSMFNDIGSSSDGYYYQSYSATNPASDGPPKLLDQGPLSDGAIIDPGSTDTDAVRLKALWKPTANFQALGLISYNENNTGGLVAEPNPGTYQNLFSYPGSCGTVAGTTFTGTQLVCPGAGVTTHSTYYYPGEQPYVLDYYGTAEEFYDVIDRYSLDLRYTLPDGIVMRSLTGYQDIINITEGTNSYGPQNAGWTFHNNGPNTGIPSEDFTFTSPTTGKVNWIAGAYWQTRSQHTPIHIQSVAAPYQPTALPSVDIFTAFPGTIRIAAIFGQLNWQITNTLQLQVGARDNWDNNYTSNAIFNVAPAAGTYLSEPNGLGTYSILYTAAACGTITPPCYKVLAQGGGKSQYKDNVPTGKVDLNWTPLPGQNFYLFYARGYDAGGVNQSEDHPTFVPEYINDWEAGWKGRLLNGHMFTQVGAYYENVQNYQYPIEDTEAVNDTTTGSYTANFAPTLIEGISAAEQSRFGGLGVNLSADYNYTRLGNVNTINNSAFPAGFGSPTANPQCLPGHTYTAPIECFDYTPYMTNVSGEALPNAPLFQGDIAVDYLFHVGEGTVDPRVTYDYTAKQWSTIFENPYLGLPARHLLGASIEWVVGKYNTQLWGTNLADETYLDGNTGGDVYYGNLRQYGIQETYSF